MGILEVRNLGRGPRRPGPVVRVLILVLVAWRLVGETASWTDPGPLACRR